MLHHEFLYSGILVFAKDNELQTEFYEKACKDRMLIVKSGDIAKSHVSVSLLLEKSIIGNKPTVRPNVFIAYNTNDKIFDMRFYSSRNCFTHYKSRFNELGLDFKLHEIDEAPSLLACLFEEPQREEMLSKMYTSVQFSDSSQRAFYKKQIQSMNTDKVIKSHPIFMEFANVLYL